MLEISIVLAYLIQHQLNTHLTFYSIFSERNNNTNYIDNHKFIFFFFDEWKRLKNVNLEAQIYTWFFPDEVDVWKRLKEENLLDEISRHLYVPTPIKTISGVLI